MADFTKGAWVANFTNDEQRPRIAKVKDVYGTSDDLLLDLVLYSKDGERLGRLSPACGGPRNFEPACPAESWTLIEEPDFDFVGAARHGWGDRLRKITHGVAPSPAQSNALRADHPLAAGGCVHGIRMSEHCAACAADGVTPSRGETLPSTTSGKEQT